MSQTVNKAQNQIRELIAAAIEKAQKNGSLPEGEYNAFSVEVPADRNNGDYSTNAAMVNARAFRLPPRKIAEVIVENADLEGTYFCKIEIAGPGFINFFLSDVYYADIIFEVREAGDSYGRSNYGEAEYSFFANVLSPAVFYMQTYENITYGDFVVISVKNIVDPNAITFSSKPSIDFTPRFFEYGGYYHALVPIPLAYESINGGALDYEFTFNYGEVSQTIPLKLTKRPTGKDSQNIPLETINELRNETTRAKFNQIMSPYFENQNSKVYWMDDNMIVPPTTRKVRSGFGIDIILSQACYTYLLEGVN